MTILLSFAHPDDESFYTAGIARRYTEAGVGVVLSCATRGQRGSAGDPPLTTPEELPEVREGELRAAAEIMGLTRIEMLPYEDRKLSEAPPAEIRAALVGLIRRHRPAIVITFEPNGGNLHRDQPIHLRRRDRGGGRPLASGARPGAPGGAAAVGGNGAALGGDGPRPSGGDS